MGKILILFSIINMLHIQPALADTLVPVGANLAELWQILEQNNPELSAARLDSAAAEQRAAASGALPDPSVRVEWQDINQASGVTLNPSQVAAVKYSVLQPIPGWGKRDAQKQTAAASVSWAKAQQQVVRADLRAQLTLAFIQYYRSFHALQLNDELKQFALSAGELAKSRYERGLGSQQDWIKAQLDQAALRSEHLVLQADVRKTQARLNALLNRSADAVLASPQHLPVLPLNLIEAPLQQRLAANPQLLRQNALSATAEGELAIAAKNETPDFIVAVAPVQRGNGVSSWDAMLEFTVPLQRGSHSAHRHEADQRLQASQAREQALRQTLQADLSEHIAAFNASFAQWQLVRQQSLPLLQITLSSALAAYQNNQLDYATVWQARREVQRTQLDELDALSSQHLHLAEIERLLGEPL